MTTLHFDPEYPRTSLLVAFIAVPAEYKPAAMQILECMLCEHRGECASRIAFFEAPHLERGPCHREATQ